MAVNQKREFVRLNIALPVRFRIIDEEGEGNPDKIEEGVTIDISAGGALLYTPTKLQVGQKLEIELQFSEDESFFCQAHIIRLFKTDQIRIAIEYDDVSEAQRDKIFRFIFEKQREWIKKGIL